MSDKERKEDKKMIGLPLMTKDIGEYDYELAKKLEKFGVLQDPFKK